jgi:hypothetical protein
MQLARTYCSALQFSEKIIKQIGVEIISKKVTFNINAIKLMHIFTKSYPGMTFDEDAS